MSKIAQQSSFPSLTSLPATAIGRAPKEMEAKPPKEVENAKGGQKQNKVGGANEKTKDEEWKKWGIDVRSVPSSGFHFLSPALASVSSLHELQTIFSVYDI